MTRHSELKQRLIETTELNMIDDSIYPAVT